MMGGRTYKQCRERFTNYLREGLNCGPWTKEEDALLLEMHNRIGNKWAEIARHLKGRWSMMVLCVTVCRFRVRKSDGAVGQEP